MGKRIVGLVLQALLGWWLWTPAALAATINVTTTADVIANNGQCSLREAIINANNNNQSGSTDCTAGLGADTIVLVAGQTYTLSLDSDGSGHATDSGTDNDDLDIVAGSTVTIAGNGATIERSETVMCDLDGTSEDGEFRIFEVVGTGNLTLHNVTIRNGCADGLGFDDDGGGIRNNGTLTITNSTLSDNSAEEDGGGIRNNGTLTITNSTLSDNSAEEDGGGIRNNGTLTITNSTLSDNSAEVDGGGIRNNGTLTITNSTLSDNSAEGDGGGIDNFGTVDITNSTLSDNSAEEDGGGIRNNGTLTITNSTLSGNSAEDGGGILNDINGTLTITNSTLSGNSANDDGGGIDNFGMVDIKNSIVGNSPSGGDCSGTFTASGVNFDTDGTCTGFTQVSSAALNLGPLANNGGPTQTHALLFGSVAINAVPAGQCTDLSSNPVTQDQRGVSRPQDTLCDVGAYEAVLVSVPVAGTGTTAALVVVLGALGIYAFRRRRQDTLAH